MIGAELHVISGKHSGQVIPLNRRKFLIGRESDCQLRPNSELVSRHHCVFSLDEHSVRLRDLGSTNGSKVNGERIVKETTLIDGDHVVVGNLEFAFRVLNPASESGDETVISSNETVMEISSPSADSSPAETQPIAVPIHQPQPVSGDTTVIAQHSMTPGQVPYQPMMPQQMGYPGQMYGGYPYQPPMPMYPYPQQLQPMMPGQIPGYSQQPVPVAQQPVPVAQPTDSAPSTGVQDVSLPDPSQTGAVDEPPKPAVTAAPADAAGGNDGDSTNAAADIIRQYTQQRPG